MCPISSTPSDLVHKFHVLSTIYYPKILNSRNFKSYRPQKVIRTQYVPFRALPVTWSTNFMFLSQASVPRCLNPEFQVIRIKKSHLYPMCPILSTSSDLVHKFPILSTRYLISKFQVIWTTKSHPYPMCPISSTSSDLVHKLPILSTIYCSKILNFQISSHMDHKKSSVPNVSHF
jgi:hypothetical protein